MPNCDFYAAREDAIAVLDFVFENTDCEVHEIYSVVGEEIHQFPDIEAVMASYDQGQDSPGILLHLYSPRMLGHLSVRRFQLNADKFGTNAWRSNSEGWGCIQLYLYGPSDGALRPCHTNHNTEKRALAWEGTYADTLGPVAAWDWKAVAAVSSKINRFIRNRLAADKVGSRPLLPQANKLLVGGDVVLKTI